MLDEITFTKPKLVSKVSLNRKFRISFFDKEEYKHCWGSVSTQIFKQFAEDIEGNKAVRTNKLREAWLYSVSNIQSNSSTKKSINYLYDYIELRLLNSIHRKNVENKNVLILNSLFTILTRNSSVLNKHLIESHYFKITEQNFGTNNEKYNIGYLVPYKLENTMIKHHILTSQGGKKHNSRLSMLFLVTKKPIVK